MKRYILIIIILSITVLITSCAAIRKTVSFKAGSEDWKRTSSYSSTYLYSTSSDSIYIKIADFPNIIFIGPAPIPVFPTFLFSWSKKADILEIDIFFDINKPYTINLDAIRFMSNNTYLLPFKTERINKNGNQTIIVENKVLRTDTFTHFRMYFDKKVKK